MDLVLRATVVFVVIWIVTRVSGRRELSTMQPIDVILLVVIGDMVQQGVTQDQSVTGAMLVIFTFTLLTVLFRLRELPVPQAAALMDASADPRRERPDPRAQPAPRAHHPCRAPRRGPPATDPRARRRALAVLETSGSISFIPR